MGARRFIGLPFRGRIALLVVLGLIAVVDLVIDLSDPTASWQDALFGVAMTFATALFAWWPTAASLSLLLTGLVQTSADQDGSQLLYLAAVAGLVSYTSPVWFVALYVVSASGLALLESTTADVLTGAALPVLVLVLAVSSAIGLALRAAHERERRFALDISQLEHARAVAINAERERISDELHDIIAHDVTLVSMHARVLERIDDPVLRDQSIRAIRDSADQALADIRRLLRIVRDEQPPILAISDERQPTASSALESAGASLAGLGADITVRATPGLVVSHSVEQTLVHLLREGATNIAKHAPQHPTVTITLDSVGEYIQLELTNSTKKTPPFSDIPSSGYGLDRLRERVSLLGGELKTHATDATWALTARLPMR